MFWMKVAEMDLPCKQAAQIQRMRYTTHPLLLLQKELASVTANFRVSQSPFVYKIGLRNVF